MMVWMVVVLGFRCDPPPASVLDQLRQHSRSLVAGPLEVAPDYPAIPAPEPRFHLAGCTPKRIFVADLAYRVIYVLDASGKLRKRFFIRSDHTPPFSMFQVGSYWVMVAYRHDPAVQEEANWGTWIQVYDTAGRFLHSLFPVPKSIRKLGWKGGFQVHAVPVGEQTLWAVFNISDCVYAIRLPEGPVKPVFCGLQDRLHIPAADPDHPVYPETGSPRVEGWVLWNGTWDLVVLDAFGKRDTLHVEGSDP